MNYENIARYFIRGTVGTPSYWPAIYIDHIKENGHRLFFLVENFTAYLKFHLALYFFFLVSLPTKQVISRVFNSLLSRKYLEKFRFRKSYGSQSTRRRCNFSQTRTMRRVRRRKKDPCLHFKRGFQLRRLVRDIIFAGRTRQGSRKKARHRLLSCSHDDSVSWILKRSREPTLNCKTNQSDTAELLSPLFFSYFSDAFFFLVVRGIVTENKISAWILMVLSTTTRMIFESDLVGALDRRIFCCYWIECWARRSVGIVPRVRDVRSYVLAPDRPARWSKRVC